MNEYDEIDDFLLGGRGGPNAFPKGTPIGTIVKGTIVDAVIRQSTDPETGKPKFFDNGNPMKQLVVSLQTDLSDAPDDNGLRRLFAYGNLLRAIREAVQKSGEKLLVGGKLAVKRTGQDEPKNKAFQGAWTYTANYEPPARGIELGADDLL